MVHISMGTWCERNEHRLRAHDSGTAASVDEVIKCDFPLAPESGFVEDTFGSAEPCGVGGRVRGEFDSAGPPPRHWARRVLAFVRWSVNTLWHRRRRGRLIETDFGDACLLIDLGAARRGVLQEEVVELGADDVPSAVGLAKRDKVRVCPTASQTLMTR